MRSHRIVTSLAALAVAALCAVGAGGAAAATKYNACGLLTSADVAAVLRAKVTRTGDYDFLIEQGLWKGETVSQCAWTAAPYSVAVHITRAPRNARERAEGVAALRSIEEDLRTKGWAYEHRVMGGTDCIAVRAPANKEPKINVAGCIVETRGRAFNMAVAAPGAVVPTMQQAKALADRAVPRVR